MHTVCRRGTVGARQNLLLNLLVDVATVHACSIRLPDHPQAVKLICTVQLTSTHALKLTHDRCPASSTAGGSGARHPGGCSVADNLFNDVQRCIATPTARTQRPISPSAEYSHVVLSPLRCLEDRSDGTAQRQTDGRAARPHCRRCRHHRRPRRCPPRPPKRGMPLGRPDAHIALRSLDLTLTLTYSHYTAAVPTKPHARLTHDWSRPVRFAVAQSFASPSRRRSHADAAVSAHAGAPPQCNGRSRPRRRSSNRRRRLRRLRGCM